MIPKVIHYCWFGGNEKSKEVMECIKSWEKYCPDFEVVEWNERNYDVMKNAYTKQAYEAKKWAFVSDYARLDIIYEHGGIYLDTDVELISNIECLLDCEGFLAMEAPGIIATGLGFGAAKHMTGIKLMLDEYSGVEFVSKDGKCDMTPCPTRNTRPFEKLGLIQASVLQRINGMQIYPPEYFAPLDYETGVLKVTNNTVAIHHFSASWKSESERKIQRDLQKLDKSKQLYKLRKNYIEIKATIKCDGFIYTMKLIYAKIQRFISKR